MTIGLDFDNTIVSYDRLFHRVAKELGVITPSVAANKNAVRDFLRQTGQEPIWTEMQGIVYGSRMHEAEAYPAATEVIRSWVRAGHRVCIISHKTRHPFVGEKHDLHLAARRWLEQNGFFDLHQIGLASEDLFFELTKEAKLQRVGDWACDLFVDDLPEILVSPLFPVATERILFDPQSAYQDDPHWTRLASWQDIGSFVLNRSRA
jgi:hypothetical protein